MQTTDGWTISTIEQEGQYAGEEMGKVWLKSPTPHANSWRWYSFGSTRAATKAAQKAQSLTQEAFEAWHESLEP